MGECQRPLNFNSHAHVERDCTQFGVDKCPKYFNSHAHVERDWLYDSVQPYAEYNFNSHAHVERDICAQVQPINFLDFNSHAHVERDYCSGVIFPLSAISTHTLTWSVTTFSVVVDSREQISTHTLTWSVTRGTRQSMLRSSNFNSHAHVERDVNENRAHYFQNISTHTLTWSVTSTRLYLTGTRIRNFNSHAHVERDHRKLIECEHFSVISTHTLTWSVTGTAENGGLNI